MGVAAATIAVCAALSTLRSVRTCVARKPHPALRPTLRTAGQLPHLSSDTMQRLVLRDGRCLAYSWFGSPSPPRQPTSSLQPAAGEAALGAAAAPTRVLVHFHGFLSSRLEAALLDADARRHGLSVLAVDRPGHGGSTLNPQQVPLPGARAAASRCRLPPVS